jgi:hypothetical protein
VVRNEPFKPDECNSVRAGLRQVRDPLLVRKILTRQAIPSIEPPQTHVFDLSSQVVKNLMYAYEYTQGYWAPESVWTRVVNKEITLLGIEVWPLDR